MIPLDAVKAIEFAVGKIDDHFDRLEFLRLWLLGEWGELHEGWPEAFI